MTKIKFYFLLLISEKEKGQKRKPYYEISKHARDKIINYIDNHEISEGDQKDHDRWFVLKGTIKNNNVEICHYKMRIIVKVEREVTCDDFACLFIKARKERKNLSDEINIDELMDELKEVTANNPVSNVFGYTLIEVFKDYKSKYFKSLGLESITSFLYEIPDYNNLKERNWLKKIFSISIPKALIRLSRPSVMTSKMSNFMRMETINILYDSCLYDMRKYNSNKIDNDTFRKMKEHFGKILYDNEFSYSGAENTRTLYILSILMGFGAIASILAIVTLIPFLIKQEPCQYMPYLKTACGLVLLTCALIYFIFALSKK